MHDFYFLPGARLSYGCARTPAGAGQIEVAKVLPNIWLMAATFVFSFLAVFAGLRLMASSHLAQEQLSSLPSAAAPRPMTNVVPEQRSPAAEIPVMFDLRFAVDVTPAAPVPTGLTLHALDRAAHAEPPASAPPPAAPADWPPTPPESSAVLEDAPSLPEQKVEVAALPEPAASPPQPALETGAAPDLNVAAVEPLDRGPPPKVENAGTTHPPTKPVQRAKPTNKTTKKKPPVRNAQTPAQQQPAFSQPVFPQQPAAQQRPAAPQRPAAQQQQPDALQALFFQTPKE